MSYISAILKDDQVLVWERENGERVQKLYKPPYYFYTDDPDGKYTTIFDTKVSKHTFNNSFEFHKAKKQFIASNVKMWESDISPVLRTLSSNYFEKPAPKLNITFLDIENNYSKDVGYASVRNPYAEINSVALYHYFEKQMVVICIPPHDNRDEWTSEKLEYECNLKLKVPDHYNTQYVICKNEKQLLQRLLAEIQDSDVLSGWNSDFFDMPYITKRVEKVLGNAGLRKLSFEQGDMPQYTEVERYGVMEQCVQFSGRITADYIELYKKYEPGERASYALEAISNIVLVDEDNNPIMPKMHYDGSLYDLYRDDFAYFVRYNIRDCEILEHFEQRLGYVQVANLNYHISCGLFPHVFGTLKLAELALINYCHYKKKRVVNNAPEAEEGAKISGALVLYPIVGLHDMVAAVDVGSLYPNILRSLNASPEKLRGQFLLNEIAFDAISNDRDVMLDLKLELTGETLTKSAIDWKDWLMENCYSLSGYGTIFCMREMGFIPGILTEWIIERKKYQALKKQAYSEGNHEMVEYYDRLQYVFKIKLNSLYGALTNKFFRWADRRLGESTTCSGRAVVKHQCRKINEIYTGVYQIDFPTYLNVEDALESGHPPETALNGPYFKGEYQSDVVVYGDTDSGYFKTGMPTIEQAIEKSDQVAQQVNDSFPKFMSDTFLCTDQFNKFITTGREIVSDRGIFVEKKRYILHVVDVEGKRCDKMKVMGLDTKKTTLPKVVADKINNFIEQFLKGKDWTELTYDIVDYKTYLETDAYVFDIGMPKGIKGVNEYTSAHIQDPKTRLPGHVAAAILYNQCLELYNDKESLPILSGMKIKYFYLKRPHGRFKSIALPTDSPFVPQWFKDNFEIDRRAHVQRLIDNPLDNIIKAIGKRAPSKQSLLVDSVLEF